MSVCRRLVRLSDQSNNFVQRRRRVRTAASLVYAACAEFASRLTKQCEVGSFEDLHVWTEREFFNIDQKAAGSSMKAAILLFGNSFFFYAPPVAICMSRQRMFFLLLDIAEIPVAKIERILSALPLFPSFPDSTCRRRTTCFKIFSCHFFVFCSAFFSLCTSCVPTALFRIYSSSVLN